MGSKCFYLMIEFVNMNYFFSALVIDSGPRDPIQLVSLGIIDEIGNEYYAESREYNILLASESNRPIICKSIDQIPPKSLVTIAEEVQAFVNHRFPSFWSYCGATEFTALCQLFYNVLPQTWPRFYHELAVKLEQQGNPRPPHMDKMANNHHALVNAHWVRKTYIWLKSRTENTSQQPDDEENAYADDHLGCF
jgi:hypothetical protein